MMTETVPDGLISCAQEIISFEPTAANPEGIQRADERIRKYLADLALEAGVQITIEEFVSNGVPSFLAYAGLERPRDAIIYMGHGDVVKAKPEMFRPKATDEVLYGRGMADMIPAVLVGAHLLVQYGSQMPEETGFMLQVGFDEETGGKNGIGYQVANEGVRGSFAIAAECGRHTGVHEIANATKGVIQATVSFSEQQGAELPLVREGAVAITDIQTGDTDHNQVPNEAAINVLLGAEPDRAIAQLDSTLAALGSEATITYLTHGSGTLATVSFSGTSAHGSRPWLGDNAVLRALDFANELARQYTLVPNATQRAIAFADQLRTRYPAAATETCDSTVTITAINTGTDDKQIVEIKLDARLAPGDEDFTSEDAFTGVLEAIDPSVDVAYQVFSGPMYTDPSNERLQQLLIAAEAVEGAPSEFVTRHGSSDARYLAQVGIAACEYGIAGEGAHSNNEHITRKSLDEFYRTMCRFLEIVIESETDVELMEFELEGELNEDLEEELDTATSV